MAADVVGQAHGIPTHGGTGFNVVTADEGRVVVGVGFAVEEDHGYALLLDASNGFSHACRLGGSHDE